MLVLMRARFGSAVGVLLLVLTIVPSLTRASVRRPLSTFVVVNSNMNMSVYSSVTGARVRTLASFSPNVFTNNGLAYAPDGSAVYFTLIPGHRTRGFSLRLMRLDVASGRQTFVADGAQPAISNDGEHLAYGAAPQGLAVRDLATGQTRTIALKQLGQAAELGNASIHWLGDGSTVAIVPSGTAWDLVGKPPKLSWCGTSQSHPVIVFVHVPAPPAPLTSACVRLTGAQLGEPVVLGEDPTSPITLLAAAGGLGGKTIVEKIAPNGQVTRVLGIPNSLALSFDPSGTHLLYLRGHKRPTLTEATIANGQIIPGHWQDPRDLGALAW
jgi:hypothetical protein